jgi:hypothetical protein
MHPPSTRHAPTTQDLDKGKPTTNVAMLLPLVAQPDAAGVKQWYVPFTGALQRSLRLWSCSTSGTPL